MINAGDIYVIHLMKPFSASWCKIVDTFYVPNYRGATLVLKCWLISELEKRLKRDLKRTKALLRDAQVVLDKNKEGAGGRNIIKQLRNQVSHWSILAGHESLHSFLSIYLHYLCLVLFGFFESQTKSNEICVCNLDSAWKK